jgi:8-oxo-dGTP pyrophosphatase MutT (NUDIX family)
MFTGAGILFTDTKEVLAGYHPSRGLWSGIGGKCEEGEVPYQTAIRECAEEIFGVEPEAHVIEEIQQALRLKFPIPNGDYALYRGTFSNLITISLLLEKNGCSSNYYSFFPKSIFQLLEERLPPDDSEITVLSLFILEEKEILRDTFAPEFYEDLLQINS